MREFERAFIFQLWDNPAVYKIPPEGLACPGLFMRQEGPGVYLLVLSADGTRAAWKVSSGG